MFIGLSYLPRFVAHWCRAPVNVHEQVDLAWCQMQTLTLIPFQQQSPRSCTFLLHLLLLPRLGGIGMFFYLQLPAAKRTQYALATEECYSVEQ